MTCPNLKIENSLYCKLFQKKMLVQVCVHLLNVLCTERVLDFEVWACHYLDTAILKKYFFLNQNKNLCGGARMWTVFSKTRNMKAIEVNLRAVTRCPKIQLRLSSSSCVFGYVMPRNLEPVNVF